MLHFLSLPSSQQSSLQKGQFQTKRVVKISAALELCGDIEALNTKPNMLNLGNGGSSTKGALSHSSLRLIKDALCQFS